MSKFLILSLVIPLMILGSSGKTYAEKTLGLKCRAISVYDSKTGETAPTDEEYVILLRLHRNKIKWVEINGSSCNFTDYHLGDSSIAFGCRHPKKPIVTYVINRYSGKIEIWVNRESKGYFDIKGSCKPTSKLF